MTRPPEDDVEVMTKRGPNRDTTRATEVRMQRYWQRKEQEAAAFLRSRGWTGLTPPPAGDGSQERDGGAR